MNRRYGLLAAVSLPLLLCGCFEDLQSKLEAATEQARQFNEQSRQWQLKAEKLQGQIDSLQQTAKDFSANMVTGLDNIDPLALKLMFRKSSDLEIKNQELQKLLSTSLHGQTGDIDLGSRRLKVMVERYSGSLILNGSLNNAVEDASNQPASGELFWDGIVLQTQGYAMTIPNHAAEWINACYQHPNCASDTNWLGKIVYDDQGRSIHNIYVADVSAQINKYINEGLYITPPGKDEVFLEGRLQRAGRHDFVFEVIPKSQSWSVTLVIATVDKDGVTYPVHRVELSSQAGKTRSVPTPIYVRYNKDS